MLNQKLIDDDTALMKTWNGLRNDLRVVISILESYYYNTNFNRINQSKLNCRTRGIKNDE